MQPAKRTHGRVLTLLALLFLATFATLPSPASAVTFTQATVNVGLGAEGNPVNTISMGSNAFVTVYLNATANSIKAARSEDGGATWTVRDVGSAATTGSPNPQFRRVPGTNTILGCYLSTGGVFKFAKSTDGGFFWGLTDLPDTDKLSGGITSCAVSSHSASTVYAIMEPSTLSNSLTFLNITKSTDGGATWGTSKPLRNMTGTTEPARGGNIHILATGSNVTVLAGMNNNIIRACRSTDSGATYTTCNSVGTGLTNAAGRFNAHQFSATTYITSGLLADSTDLQFGKSTDAGASWAFGSLSVSSACTPGPACGSVTQTSIYGYNATSYVITFQSGAGVDARLRLATTSNSAQTWTVQNVPIAPTHASGSGNSVVISDAAKILVAYHFTPNGTALTRVVSLTGTFTSITLASSATVAVANLTGFDVDRTGSTVIARIENGSHVASFTATSLIQTGADALTSCSPSGETMTGTADRVLAAQDYVGYITCDPADDTDANEFHVRTATLTDPTFTGCSWCPKQWSLNGYSAHGGDGIEGLAEIIEFPMDFTRERDQLLIDYRVFAWAWMSNTGYIGVNTFSPRSDFTQSQNGAADQSQFTVEAAYTASEPEQICAWENPADGRQFVGAVDLGATTRVYEFVPNFDELQNRQEGTLPLRTTFGGDLANAIGISCGGDRIAILTPTTVTVVNHLLPASGAATIIQQYPITSTTLTRGVALSDDGDFLAYADGANVFFADLATGNITGSVDIPPPVSMFVGMELDEHAQNFWLAMTGNITRWTTYTITTGTPFGSSGDDGGDDDEPDSVNFIGTELAIPNGMTEFGFKLFMAVLLVYGMATLLGFTFGRGTKFVPIGGYMGGVAGFFMSWGFDLLNVGTVFAIIAIGALVVYFARR